MTTSNQQIPKYHLNLTLLAITLLAGYLVFWFWFPLHTITDAFTLRDVRSFAPSLLAGLAYGLLLLVLFGLYWLAFRLVQKQYVLPSLGFLLGTAVLFTLPLLQTYPINANDLYRYVIRGRISSVYDESPFATAPDAFPDDPFLPLAGEWAGETSPYGPLWELLAGGVTSLTQENLLAGLLSFKLVALLAHLACGWLIWLNLGQAHPSRQRGFTLLWLWNPALLLMFVVDGHNDVLMMVWQLIAIWLWRQKRPFATLLSLLLAALTKPIALLPLPFFAVAIWCQLPDNAARLRVFGWTVVGGGTAVWLAFLPFGSPFDLVIRLFREASNNPGFSPATLVLLLVSESGQPITAQFFDLVANLFRLPYGLLALWLMWVTWRNGRSPLRAAADVLATYSLQALSFRLWYSTWPFLWLLLEEEAIPDNTVSFRLRAQLWYLLLVQVSVLIYGHLRAVTLGGSHFTAHLIGVPFVFLLPILLAVWTNPQARQQQTHQV